MMVDHPSNARRQRSNPPPRDIDAAIFHRRRTRALKVCYPCRRRKVKCNRGQPCDKCSDRGHPDLCIYTARSSISLPVRQAVTTNKNDDVNEEHLPTQHRIQTIQEGLYVDSLELYSSKVYLGPGSLPQLLAAYPKLRAPNTETASAHLATEDVTPQAIFETLCLHNSGVNFPFAVLWSPNDGPEKVCTALPSDDVVQRLYQYCQESIFHLLPIIDFSEFEATLAAFLDTRKETAHDDSVSLPSQCTTSWLALLFSVLACGRQLSSENQQDILAARVFACCSFHCLRLGNFISYPDIATVQSLILLVNFLSNQADAGASWTMLGLAVRLAQGVGLHCLPDVQTVRDENKKRALSIKTSIWHAILWQDTLISLSYDRAPGIFLFDTIPLSKLSTNSAAPHLSFFESLHQLSIVANKISQALERAKHAEETLSTRDMLDFQDLLNQVEARAALHVQDLSKCQSRHDRIQHYFFRVFLDSVMLCLCRSIVLTQDREHNSRFADICWIRTRAVINAYMELIWLECPTQRCWIFIHNALSCTLSLGLEVRRTKDAEDMALLTQFVEILSQTTLCTTFKAYGASVSYIQSLIES